jgi:hypothetical protein
MARRGGAAGAGVEAPGPEASVEDRSLAGSPAQSDSPAAPGYRARPQCAGLTVSARPRIAQPTKPNPANIMAQPAGSGTAVVGVALIDPPVLM